MVTNTKVLTTGLAPTSRTNTEALITGLIKPDGINTQVLNSKTIGD